MSAKLIYSTPLWLIANGIRYSHNNHYLSDSFAVVGSNKASCLNCGEIGKFDNIYGKLECKNCGFKVNENNHIGKKDFDLIKRVGFKMKHESILEHSLITYEIESSRALLQELSRHRIGVSPTVKSTRYTLKELKNEKSFYLESDFNCQETEIGKRASKYLYFTGNDRTDHNSILALENVRQDIISGVSNDIAKYALPEAFKFKGQYTFNLRSLVHLFELRTNKDALLEFQELCIDMIDVLPDDYKELIFTNEKIKNNYERIKNG